MKKFSQYIDYINEAAIPNSNDRVTNLGTADTTTEPTEQPLDLKNQPIASLD